MTFNLFYLRRVGAPESSVAAVPPKKQPMLPMLARTVMSESRPATELLYARMIPASRALLSEGV